MLIRMIKTIVMNTYNDDLIKASTKVTIMIVTIAR